MKILTCFLLLVAISVSSGQKKENIEPVVAAESASANAKPNPEGGDALNPRILGPGFGSLINAGVGVATGIAQSLIGGSGSGLQPGFQGGLNHPQPINFGGQGGNFGSTGPVGGFPGAFNRPDFNRPGIGGGSFNRPGGFGDGGFNRPGFGGGDFNRPGFGGNGFNRPGFAGGDFNRPGFGGDFNRPGFGGDFNRPGFAGGVNRPGGFHGGNINRPGFGGSGFDRPDLIGGGFGGSNINRPGVIGGGGFGGNNFNRPGVTGGGGFGGSNINRPGVIGGGGFGGSNFNRPAAVGEGRVDIHNFGGNNFNRPGLGKLETLTKPNRPAGFPEFTSSLTKPGTCPVVRPVCPDRVRSGPVFCEFDSDCKFGEKCCLDKCLEGRVCKKAL